MQDGPKTTIVNDDGEEKDFSFDFSFWSHDQFTNDDKGYSNPNPGSNYADQNQVFEVVSLVVKIKTSL